VVLDSGRISLKIATEVSSLSAQGAISLPFFGATIQVPALQVRRANSVVELPSGGSIMIAGLLQSDIINGLNGVPGIMDVPVLGALFRSSSFQRQETDLVILVNAVLVKPQAPQVLALPTDGFAPASDLDRYFLGHLQNIYVKQPVPKGNNAPALEGPIGYIVQ
jgi:pilus assembly protein CpaC